VALPRADPPSKESYRLCKKSKKLKKRPRSNKGLYVHREGETAYELRCSSLWTTSTYDYRKYYLHFYSYRRPKSEVGSLQWGQEFDYPTVRVEEASYTVMTAGAKLLQESLGSGQLWFRTKTPQVLTKWRRSRAFVSCMATEMISLWSPQPEEYNEVYNTGLGFIAVEMNAKRRLWLEHGQGDPATVCQ
jgi:hypothetical protein